jgi:hypothetical protein
MDEVLKEQQRMIASSKEYADQLLTELNIKHFLVPRGTNKASSSNDSL